MNSLESLPIVTSVASIIIALGGWKFVNYIINRNSIKREDEIRLQNKEMQSLREHVDWIQEKYESVSKKLEDLERRFRQLEEENIKLLKENSELKIALNIAEYNRCERPDDDCIRRIPRREKCRLRMLLNGSYEKEDGTDGEVSDGNIPFNRENDRKS